VATENLFHTRDDADLAALDGVTVAVLGYGNLGRSMALNLRDSGLTVVVGNRDGGELAADNPAGLRSEHAGHFLAVEGKSAEKAPVLGDQPVPGGGPVEADLGESLQRARHLP